jgi:hypothetical protein
MAIIATGKEYKVQFGTIQELDAVLKMVIKRIPDGFFDFQSKGNQFSALDLKVDLSSDAEPPLFLDMFYNGLITNYFGDYDISLATAQSDYDKARDKVIEGNPHVCWEDVLLQVLSDGNLVFEDHYQGMTIKLDLSEVGSNFLKAFNDAPDYFMELVLLHAKGGSDGITYDSWLQMGTYGEVIYG